MILFETKSSHSTHFHHLCKPFSLGRLGSCTELASGRKFLFWMTSRAAALDLPCSCMKLVVCMHQLTATLVVLIMAASSALSIQHDEGFDRISVFDLLNPPGGTDHNEVVIASAMNTGSPVLRSSDGSYAWQFLPDRRKTNTRLLVVLNTLYNSTVVWIGNRDYPVSANATLLLQLPSRSLLLRDANGSVAWSPSVNNIGSVLMNSTGNLLVQDARNSTLWQSFDYPADVMVPGQRLRTNRTITASVDFGTGDVSTGHNYMLKAEPGGAVLYASFDAQQSKVPYMLINYVNEDGITTSLQCACNHTAIVYNEKADGMLLQQDGVITPECRKEITDQYIRGISFVTRMGGEGFRYLRLMPTGDIDSFLLSSTGLHVDNEFFKGFYSTYCLLPSYCGANSLCSSVQTCTCPDLFEYVDPSDPTRGCRLVTPLDCSISRQHQFLEVPGVDYYANSFLPPLPVISADQCTALCLANCSCTTAFFNGEAGTCHTYDQVRTMQSGSKPCVTAFMRVAQLPFTASSTGSSGPRSRKAIISMSVGFSLMVASVVLLASWNTRNVTKRGESDSEEEAFLEGLPGLPPRFSYKEIHSATQGFSKRLGTGASGAVYEGDIQAPPSGPPDRGNNQLLVKVAVKELKQSERPTIAASGKKQFRAEVATLGSLSHVNLVQLRGFCAEGAHRLLIYEYLENGSLDRWLFPKSSSSSDGSRYILPWEVRYRIALDTARGLAFLHEECRDKVVHLDVKPQNILLDGSFRAKLADFGLCKLMDRDGHESQTVTAMRGTPGYMAPEWFLNLPITDKSDVFSYGMVLLELVGGRKNLNLAVAGEEWYFPAWAVKQAESGRLFDVVDRDLLTILPPNTETNLNMEDHRPALTPMLSHMKRLLYVAFWCIQANAASRPSMATVLLMLEEHLQVPDPPLDLTYVHGRQSRPEPVASISSTAGLVDVLSVMSPR